MDTVTESRMAIAMVVKVALVLSIKILIGRTSPAKLIKRLNMVLPSILFSFPQNLPSDAAEMRKNIKFLYPLQNMVN